MLDLAIWCLVSIVCSLILTTLVSDEPEVSQTAAVVGFFSASVVSALVVFMMTLYREPVSHSSHTKEADDGKVKSKTSRRSRSGEEPEERQSKEGLADKPKSRSGSKTGSQLEAKTSSKTANKAGSKTNSSKTGSKLDQKQSIQVRGSKGEE